MDVPTLFHTIPSEIKNIILYYSTPDSCLTLSKIEFKQNIINNISRDIPPNIIEDDLLAKQNIQDIISKDNYEIIMKASELGNINFMQELIDNGINISLFDGDVIAIAASKGHFTMCKYLHNNNIDLDDRALLSAAEGGHLEIVKWIVENDIYTFNLLQQLRVEILRL